MIFPAGLGHSYFRMPIASFILSVICVVVYFENGHISTAIDSIFNKDFNETTVAKNLELLFEQYCEQQDVAPSKCTKTSKTFIEFIGSLSNKEQSVTKLRNYPNYLNAQAEAASKSTIPNLIGISDVQWAGFQKMISSQFFHQSWMQLLFTLLILISFGSYVEHRMGMIAFFVLYISGGFTLQALESFSLIPRCSDVVGATANSAAVVGAFFFLFRRHRMSLNVWYVNNTKEFRLPIQIWLPVIYGGILTLQGMIVFNDHWTQYIMHLLALVPGTALAFIYMAMFPLPPFFLYDFEYRMWTKIRSRASSTREQLAVARVILDFNPANVKVRLDLCRKIALDLHSAFTEQMIGLKFLLRNIDPMLTKLYESGQRAAAYSLLTELPLKAAYQKVFIRISDLNLLRYSKHANQQKNYKLAMFMLATFVEKFPNSTSAESVLRSLDVIISKEYDEDDGYELIAYLEESTSEVRVKNLINRHLQFGQTAIVTKAGGST